MEEELLSSHARTSSGTLKLELVHAALQSYLAEGLDNAGCEYRDEKFVRDWAAATPHNPAPVITDAALHLKQGWCFRGIGYADSVKTDAWPKFRRSATASFEALEADKAMASADPEFYAVKLNTLIALGADDEIFQIAVDEATAREPDYHRIYYNAVWHYLPQWGGSFEAVDKFARYAVDRSRADEKASLYARIYWSLEDCNCHLIEKHADWIMMKQSMRDIFDLYPTRWNGEYSSNLACKMGDRDEGRRYLREMHPEARDESSFAALFASCDRQAAQPA